MPHFKYTALNPKTNARSKAVAEAENEEEIIDLLEEKGLILVSLKKVAQDKLLTKFVVSLLNRVKTRDLVIFSRQFAVMLEASVPVVKALEILIKQTKNPKLQTLLAEVADNVDGGMKLSQAFAKHPEVFGDFFIAMIKSGETSGRLDEVLEYSATQQEKDYDLASKIKGAMIYPIFIVCMLFVVGIVMMIVVVPKLTAILQETGGELPLSTRILISVSSFLAGYWWLLIILLTAVGLGLKYFLKTPTGKKSFDYFLIKIPIFGKLFQRIYLVRFARSLATLSSGGIPLVNALQITSEVVGNSVYRELIDKTVLEVKEGNSIASTFKESKEMPSMVTYMVDVGEQTGKLDNVLEKLSDFYAREIDNLVVNLVSLIEPLIMVVLGVAVGLMVAAIILPMYNLASSF
ncbi:type II secretion system F family protein [Candidatus Parcubacteria bacterium]|nr:type II secretion system F family protein [Patescibacteria group bacterium]MCG2686770.1 type II secretion system F family protein [Candidatus Parcubacteria bacterium]